jgi:hypothetical protein
MNQICEKRIQSATDMLKHVAAHNASRAFAAVGPVMRPEPEVVPSDELSPHALAIPARGDRFGLAKIHFGPSGRLIADGWGLVTFVFPAKLRHLSKSVSRVRLDSAHRLLEGLPSLELLSGIHKPRLFR